VRTKPTTVKLTTIALLLILFVPVSGQADLLVRFTQSTVRQFDRPNRSLQLDATSWHIETVDTQLGRFGGHTSLALDADGYPHISYHDAYPNYDLKYAYQEASGWHIETVDSEGHVGEYTCLALDGNGNPHISYYSYYYLELYQST